VYLDDILIFSRSLDDHKRHVRRVLERLRDNGLFAKPEKCAFHRDEIEYLGYIVSPRGVQMDPKKVSAIVDWPEPASVRQLQVFLGFANFYRRFIHSYSKVASPLTRLLKKDRVFDFDDPARQAFQQLKTVFTTAPVLAHFHPDRPSTVETDASDFAIAAVLSQPDSNSIMHPVAFYSRKLTAPELNYEIYDKEMLAIVTAVKEWRAYLEGAAHPFTVFTDHKNLEYFATTKVLNRRQARWAELLANYNFTIVYRPGKSMGKPDAMSRRHDLSEGSKTSDTPARTLLKPGQLQLAAARTVAAAESPLLSDIRAAQPLDPALHSLIPMLRDPEIPRDADARRRLNGLSLSDGLVLFNGLIYVPDRDAIKLQILRQCHDDPTAGHFGQAKTHERVMRHYYWPRMRRFVNRYVSTCDTCARSKTPRHKPHGFLVPLPVPSRPWGSISMDFVVGLPRSPTGNDAIFVVVDRLTKMAHFIPTTTSADASDVADLFAQQIFRLHGLPDDIVSDRDKIFTSKFWRHFLATFNIRSNLSTAFHPQTDGQTERVNQVLEQYLRAYCNYQQDDWHKLLHLAEFAYNSAIHSSTGKTPFFANYGLHPADPSTCKPAATSSTNPAAEERAKIMRSIHQQLQHALTDAIATQARFYNRKVKEAPQFQIGDQVWLLRRNIITTRPSDKLDYKRLGPFRVTEKIGKVNYRLQLPASMKIHPVFHVNLLEPFHPNDIPGRVQDPPPPVTVDGHEEFEVEEILDSRTRRGQLQYYVHWKDWPVSNRTWEPAANLANAPDLVDAFHRTYPRKSRPRSVPAPINVMARRSSPFKRGATVTNHPMATEHIPQLRTIS
jgi:transposase InsO family protein